ncbi:MAG: DUF371 domain-containing protein [Nitrososphaerota archaeon]|nr:DUF371 domain-containing protein [Nitrososphaerota archaeon]
MTTTVTEAEVARDVVTFKGHAMVRSMHPTTMELTTEEDLTENGDCIVGVGASKGCAGLDVRVREKLRRSGSMVTIRLVAEDESFELRARGDPRLLLSHPHDMVIRRSDFVSDRTLALGADAAARDIPRRLVALLRDPKTTGRMEIEVR